MSPTRAPFSVLYKSEFFLWRIARFSARSTIVISIGAPDTRAVRSMLHGLSGGFEAFAALAIIHGGKPGPGPLDSVPLRDDLEWWRERDARFGRMDGEGLRIVWQDEKESP